MNTSKGSDDMPDFSSDYIEGDEKQKILMYETYIGKHIIFESYEPFKQYGFNIKLRSRLAW